MNNIWAAFKNYLKDPFGKKELMTKHNKVIADIRSSSAVLKESNELVMAQEKGANAFDRAILGHNIKRD